MFSSAGKTFVEISVIGFLMGTCVAFFVVIGDLSPVIVSKIFNLHNYNHDSLRRWLIIIITVTCIIPLSFQRSIQSLAFVCKASIGFYICLTLKTVLESFERFENDPDWFSNIDLWKPSGVLQCIPIFSMAMSCQMQLFEVYDSMGFPGSKFDGIARAVDRATFICCAVYSIIGFFGYVAFYNQTLSGNILVNFTPSLSNDVITIGFVLSIAASFPLVIFPCRTSLESLLQRRAHHTIETSSYIPESKFKPLTLFIIGTTMVLGILVPSVEVIISLVGSTIGVLICVIFPATCFVKIMKRDTLEKKFAQAIIVIGFLIMIFGTYANLDALDSSKSGSHFQENILVNEKLIHPKDIHRINQGSLDNLKNFQLLDSVEKVKDESPEAIKISDDSIKKEEMEIAADQRKDLIPKSPQQEIKEKNDEIKELKESKDKLEQEVKEIKEELVKQNKETQELVKKKFDEIAEKVEKISIENEKEKASADQVDMIKSDTGKLPEVLTAEAPIQQQYVFDIQKASKDDTKEINQQDVTKNEPEIVLKAEESLKNEQLPETRPDPIVKLLQSNQQKAYEPLSYQIGEKMMESKHNQTPPEVVKLENVLKQSSKEKDLSAEHHNEIRRKRAPTDDLTDSLDLTLHNFEIKSMMISRDLKAVPSEPEA